MGGANSFWTISLERMNLFKKIVSTKKERTHRGTHGRSLISFGFDDVITRAKKDVVFLFVRPSRSFQGTLPWSVWETLGAKYQVCWHQSNERLFVLNFGWKRENLKKKWKKRFFELAKNGKHGYFCWWPTGLPDNFSGFYYFFLLEDMSVMCLSLLTNSVGLKG